MLLVNRADMQCRKSQITYKGVTNTKRVSGLSKEVIDRLDINMECRKGYKGETDYMLAPDSIGAELAQVFRRMKINWLTHIGK